MGLYAFLFRSHSGDHLVLTGILLMSGGMAVSALANFCLQWLPARKRYRQQTHKYELEVAALERHLQELSQRELQGQLELDPPLSGSEETLTTPIIPIVQRSFNNQDVQLWSRRPDDPDFLSVRIGMGQQAPHFQLHTVQPSTTSLQTQLRTLQCEKLAELYTTYTTLELPLKIALATSGTLALLGEGAYLQSARRLALTMLTYIAYHHSPADVRIIILAPESQRSTWEGAALLPQTITLDQHVNEKSTISTSNTRVLRENRQISEPQHMVAIGDEAVAQQLALISREVSHRSLQLTESAGATSPTSPTSPHSERAPLLPHILIFIDHFEEQQQLEPTIQFMPYPLVKGKTTQALRQAKAQRAMTSLLSPSSAPSLLQRAELDLALHAERELGLTVIAICQQKEQLPPSTAVLIEIEGGTAGSTLPATATIRHLRPDAQPAQHCERVDSIAPDIFRHCATRLQPLRAASPQRLELPTLVDICTLFEPPIDPANYEPQHYWQQGTLRDSAGEPLLRIPIGMKIGDEIQYLDLLKDGPHGLLIGQTGSGKSELLQTIITGLAVAYRPAEINFLLIDYKAGLALEPFSRLPHTIGFLSNISSAALIQRFITMLRAEALRRELRLKEGQPTPRLIIIIDEFAELVKRTENILEELFTITRIGREIGMHLLLAAQRPEGIIGNKVRDYVQYRLCLRCSSPEDSREVLRRAEAAYLPANVPGRAYLLHGDNQLDLFQAARVTVPIVATTREGI